MHVKLSIWILYYIMPIIFFGKWLQCYNQDTWKNSHRREHSFITQLHSQESTINQLDTHRKSTLNHRLYIDHRRVQTSTSF